MKIFNWWGTQFSRQNTDWRPEIVIPVVSINGAEKSDFVKCLQEHGLPLKSRIGHLLTTRSTATSRLNEIPLTFPEDDLLKHYTIVLVETPVFDGQDTAVLRRMTDRSGKAYHCIRILGGVIYLHDISSDDRLSEEERKILETFNLMCAAADVALSMVIFGTTNWTRIDQKIGEDHEGELEAVHWKSMLEEGARTKRFEDSYESALSFIKDLVIKLISTSQSAPDSRPEVIIPVMGITGAGKSTFVNYLVQDEALRCSVGHGLASCTVELHSIPLNFPDDELLKHYRITLVDTPGFDNTNLEDAALLRLMTDWLAKAYRDKKILGGIIFLHDINYRMLSRTERSTFDLLNLMCGDAALGKVIFGTTNWTQTSRETGEGNEQELMAVHWGLMLKMGAQYRRFEDSYESALSFVKQVIMRDDLLHVNLKIQTEIVDECKILPETQTGQRYFWPQEEVLAMHTQMQRELAHLAIAKVGTAEAATAAQQYEETARKIDDLILQIQWPKVLQFVHMMKRFVTS